MLSRYGRITLGQQSRRAGIDSPLQLRFVGDLTGWTNDAGGGGDPGEVGGVFTSNGIQGAFGRNGKAMQQILTNA